MVHFLAIHTLASFSKDSVDSSDSHVHNITLRVVLQIPVLLEPTVVVIINSLNLSQGRQKTYPDPQSSLIDGSSTYFNRFEFSRG